MGKDYVEIDERIERWINRQHLFFVSTAPLSHDGLINCSPKGLNGLRVLNPKKIAYADAGGSGIETVAHLKENGRIVVMLCAFEGPPKIFRFYGIGRSVEPHESEYKELLPLFPDMHAVRNFVVIEVNRIRDACGFGVPVFDYKSERDSLKRSHSAKSADELQQYRSEKNSRSLDDLPGLDLNNSE